MAGDDNRAAVFFLGSATPGTVGANGPDPAGFTGTWYGYISTTYDGGRTWTTVNGTPNDPVQRGPICTQGTLTCTGTTRNLLDFNDVTIDAQGRVLAAYADGCISAQCVQGNDLNGDGKLDGNDNDGSEQATIIRQSGGKSLFSQHDSQFVTNLPGAPLLIAHRTARSLTFRGLHLTMVALPSQPTKSIVEPGLLRRFWRLLPATSILITTPTSTAAPSTIVFAPPTPTAMVRSPRRSRRPFWCRV